MRTIINLLVAAAIVAVVPGLQGVANAQAAKFKPKPAGGGGGGGGAKSTNPFEYEHVRLQLGYGQLQFKPDSEKDANGKTFETDAKAPEFMGDLVWAALDLGSDVKLGLRLLHSSVNDVRTWKDKEEVEFERTHKSSMTGVGVAFTINKTVTLSLSWAQRTDKIEEDVTKYESEETSNLLVLAADGSFTIGWGYVDLLRLSLDVSVDLDIGKKHAKRDGVVLFIEDDPDANNSGISVTADFYGDPIGELVRVGARLRPAYDSTDDEKEWTFGVVVLVAAKEFPLSLEVFAGYNAGDRSGALGTASLGFRL